MAGVCIAFGAGTVVAAYAPMQDVGMQAVLQVEYYYSDFGHVDEVLEYASSKSSAQGEPLPNLDSHGGVGKKVLNQKHRDFVAAIITGFINFPTSGTHMIKIRSNDGVRIAIGGLALAHLSVSV